MVDYGVFTYFRLPSAIPLHEGITINQDCFCLLLRKTNANTVEVKGTKGSQLTLVFSTVREASAYGEHIERFARACCEHVPDEGRCKGFKLYFARLLENALANSHGTILLCSKSDKLLNLKELKDAVSVTPLLDFQAAFAEFQASNSADAILTLQRCEDLLQGFLRCDGMIAFDTAGRVIAYRVFYKPSKNRPLVADVVGGARRRAFEGVKALIGDHLSSVLFRSQDGLTIQCGVKA